MITATEAELGGMQMGGVHKRGVGDWGGAQVALLDQSCRGSGLGWSLPTESGHSGRCADVGPWLFFSR